MKTKQILSLLFALLMIVTAMLGMVACGDDTPDDDEPDDPINNPDDNGDDQPQQDAKLPLDLPDVNYNGQVFNILEWTVDDQTDPGMSWVPWEEGDVDDRDGDTLGNAVYSRNAWVEENFGVEITKVYASVNTGTTITTRIRNNASGTDDEFQLITMRTTGMTSLIQEGLFADMNEYPELLHTDQPWWVADSVDSFRLGSRLYVAATELLLRDKGATGALYFNQTLAEDYSTVLPDFFELAREGAWTMEEMSIAGETVSHSNDGNDLMDSVDDIWGLWCNDDFPYLQFNAAGFKFAHIDEDGYIEYDYAQDTDVLENSLVVMQSIFSDYIYSDWALHDAVPGKKEIVSGLSEAERPFVRGTALFWSGMVKDTTTALREMEDLYGILPHPKLNEDQEEYSSLVWVHHDSVLGIPSATLDPEFCATILEAISYQSYYTVYSTFHETILLNRAAKEENSKEMLKIIFDTRSYDPGQIWDNDSNTSGLHGGEGILRLSATGTADIAGMWAKLESKVTAVFEDVNEWIASGEVGDH